MANGVMTITGSGGVPTEMFMFQGSIYTHFYKAKTQRTRYINRCKRMNREPKAENLVILRAPIGEWVQYE